MGSEGGGSTVTLQHQSLEVFFVCALGSWEGVGGGGGC